MSDEAYLLKRIRIWTSVLMAGLLLSGLSAIPIGPEIDLVVKMAGPGNVGDWITKVHDAVHDIDEKWPFMALGTDWLAFGHIVIALGFIGLLRDPVRNEWLIWWGGMACVLVLPWAWGFGSLRGIPWGWQLVDCSFGVFGLIPIVLIWFHLQELKQVKARGGSDENSPAKYVRDRSIRPSLGQFGRGKSQR
jgi:hypothetical protein